MTDREMPAQPDPSAPTPEKPPTGKHADALSQNTNPRIRIDESSDDGEVIGIACTRDGAGTTEKPAKRPFDPSSLDIEGLEILDPNDGTAVGIMCTRPGAGTTETPPAK